MDLATIFNEINGGAIIWIVLFFTVSDVLLGILNSLKKHHFRSAINKSGIINKAAVVLCIVFFYVLDLLLGLNGIGFSEIFGATLCISELVSVIYNLQALNVPVPKQIIEILDKYTVEKEEKQDCK